MKLLSYNIRFGGVGRENLILETIGLKSPDLVVLQEAIAPVVIQQIAEKAGMPYWAARQNHSLGFCSRIPVQHQWHAPPRSRHPFLELHPEGTSTRIFGVHLRAMFSRWGEARRAHEIHALLSSIQKHQEGRHALVGDFNSLSPGEFLDVAKMPHWIRTLLWFSGRDIQRDTVRSLLERGYLDGYRFLHPEEKGYTFPTKDPHVRLDYLFIPTVFANTLNKCEVVADPPAAAASDHFPLYAELNI